MSRNETTSLLKKGSPMSTIKRMRYFDDFTVGETFPIAPIRLDEQDRLAFSTQFEGGTLFPGLSPWHVATAVWGKWVETKTDAGGMVAGMSIDFARWYRNVSVDETLIGTVTISRKRVFSTGDAGSVSFLLAVVDQNRRPVLEMEITGKMLLRTPVAPDSQAASAPKQKETEPQSMQTWHPAPFTLSEEKIIAFGLAFDDRPIHVDRHVSAQGPFGELIASGLHSMARLLGLWYATIHEKESAFSDDGTLEILNARWLSPVRAKRTIVPSITLAKKEPAPDGRTVLYYTAKLCDAKSNPLLVCNLRWLPTFRA